MYAFSDVNRPPCKGGLQGGPRLVANTGAPQGRPSPNPSLPGRGVQVPTLDKYPGITGYLDWPFCKPLLADSASIKSTAPLDVVGATADSKS